MNLKSNEKWKKQTEIQTRKIVKKVLKIDWDAWKENSARKRRKRKDVTENTARHHRDVAHRTVKAGAWMTDTTSKCYARENIFQTKWQRFTSDSQILSWVNGYKVPFKNRPYQEIIPQGTAWPADERSQIYLHIRELLEKEAIASCLPVKNQFVSNIFRLISSRPPGKYVARSDEVSCCSEVLAEHWA